MTENDNINNLWYLDEEIRWCWCTWLHDACSTVHVYMLMIASRTCFYPFMRQNVLVEQDTSLFWRGTPQNIL